MAYSKDFNDKIGQTYPRKTKSNYQICKNQSNSEYNLQNLFLSSIGNLMLSYTISLFSDCLMQWLIHVFIIMIKQDFFNFPILLSVDQFPHYKPFKSLNTNNIESKNPIKCHKKYWCFVDWLKLFFELIPTL